MAGHGRPVGRVVVGEQLQPFSGRQVGQQHLEQTLDRAQDASFRSRGPGSAEGQSALGRCAASPAAMGSGLDGVEEPGVVPDGGGQTQSVELTGDEGLEVVDGEGLAEGGEAAQRPGVE